jgi:hypothetical protein
VTIHEMQFTVPMYCSMDAIYDSHPYALPGPPAGVQTTCSTFLRPDFPVYPETSDTAQVKLVRHPGGYEFVSLDGRTPYWFRATHETEPPLFVGVSHVLRKAPASTDRA